MPYILPEDRKKLDPAIDNLIEALGATSEGELNYTFTRILNAVYAFKTNPRYANINSAVGVLDCVKLELYRRTAAPYEDVKIEENGDV